MPKIRVFADTNVILESFRPGCWTAISSHFAVESFPGPDRSIRLANFEVGRAVSRRYRNRRIGEFLKELELTEGRSTGIQKILKVMAANSSPAPLFETDDDRCAHVIRMPVHLLAQQPTDQVAPEVTPEVTPEVQRVVMSLAGEWPRHHRDGAYAGDLHG